MRRDAIFYKIFQRAPGLLFVLLDEPPTQVYKFIDRSWEEVEVMLGLNIEESRIYREIKAEGERTQKIKMVPKLLAKGFSVEEVAEIVELTCDEVRQAHQQPS